MDALIILVQNPTAANDRPPALRVFSDLQLLKLKTAFLEDTIWTCAQVDGVDLKAAVAPPERAQLVTRAVNNLHGRFPRRKVFAELPQRMELVTQPVAPLDIRIRDVLSHCFAAGYERIMMVSGYNPTLTKMTLSIALRELRRKQFVIGPTIRGGVYLLGMNQDHPELIADVPAGTDQAYRVLCEQLEEAGLDWAELDLWYDITHQEDIEFVVRDINQYRLTGDEESGKATEEVLARYLDQEKEGSAG